MEYEFDPGMVVIETVCSRGATQAYGPGDLIIFGSFMSTKLRKGFG